MTTCTIVGYRFPLDLDLEDRLAGAITFLMRLDNSIEFLIRKNTICDLVLPLLVKAKHDYPSKNICLTLVDSKERNEDINEDALFDKVILVPGSIRDSTFDMWAMEHSDTLISYVYEFIQRREQYIISLARVKGLNILDITSDETKNAIKNYAVRLPSKGRAVIEGIDAGKSRSDLARELGLTPQTVATYNSWARIKLGLLYHSKILPNNSRRGTAL